MSRGGGRALILSVGLAVAAAGAGDAAPAGASPPTPPPVASTPAAVPATAVPTTAVPVVTAPPAGTRGGAVDGSVAKPRRESWSPRRIATMTALVVVALAAAGYAYGKLRSAPPRHPDLVRRPPDLDGVDRADATR
jgi:hypothetical protein